MKKETKGVIIGGVIAGLGSKVFDSLLSSAKNTISNSMFHIVDITESEHNLSEGIKKYFKNIPDKVFVEYGSDLKNDISISYRKNIAAWDEASSTCSSTIIWNGYPITFDALYQRGDRNNRCNPMTLKTINTKKAIKNLENFISILANEHHKHEVESVTSRTILFKTDHRGGIFQYNIDIKKRTFENTFISDEHEKLIKDSIDNFKSKRDWYIKNNIPYHFGFLLYGACGLGKSCIAQAIADYADAELISFPGDRIGEFPNVIGNNISTAAISEKAYRVILIEDIDCGFAERCCEEVYDDKTKDFKTINRKVGLASILNSLDGLCAPDNAIYVFTTNHIEKLDPALIRPGRCDVKIEMSSVTYETFKKFCNYHYGEYNGMTAGEWIDDNFINDFTIIPNLTFAEIQTHVMKGDDLGELCMKVFKPSKQYPNT